METVVILIVMPDTILHTLTASALKLNGKMKKVNLGIKSNAGAL